MPGMTISPKPNIAKCVPYTPLSRKSWGKTSLMGASKDLATVTITSVPNTQNTSYTKRPPKSIHPVTILFKCNNSTPFKANARPKRLFAIQCCQPIKSLNTSSTNQLMNTFLKRYQTPSTEQMIRVTKSLESNWKSIKDSFVWSSPLLKIRWYGITGNAFGINRLTIGLKMWAKARTPRKKK